MSYKIAVGVSPDAKLELEITSYDEEQPLPAVSIRRTVLVAESQDAIFASIALRLQSTFIGNATANAGRRRLEKIAGQHTEWAKGVASPSASA